jgi:hypothetical protein
LHSGKLLKCAAWAALGISLSAPASAETLRANSVPALEHALAAAARLRAARPAEPVTIELGSGTYSPGQTLLIDEALSGTPAAPLIIRPEAGATVVLSGGRSLGPLRWERSGGGIWRARVSGPGFALLWLDGRRLIRARYPNHDPNVRPLGGYSADSTSPQRIARWTNPAGGVIQAIHKNEWGGVHVPILGKNPDGTLRLGAETGNNREGGPSEKERFVENIREELDAPDEWYYDEKAGWLYYMPRDSARPSSSGFVASRLETLFRIEGRRQPVHDVRIAGFQIRYTEPTFLKTTEPLLRSDWKFYRGGAVLIENADRVEIADSDFSELGGNAVVVSGRARAITVRDNEISHIGASAISFVGRPDAVRSPLFQYHQSLPLSEIDRTPGPKNDDYPADSLAEDNLIHDIGEIEKQSAGIEIAMAERIRVSHNSIYRVPRAGINIGDGTWGGDIIEGNDVFDTVLETGDHGALNSWGRDRYWDPDRDEMDRRVAADRSLVWLDTLEPIVIRGNRFRCDHGWDIDLDDGSSNYLIENNLLLSGGLKFREGFDRIARNNIIVNNTFHPHVWFPSSGDFFEHNIVMTGYQPILMKSWGRSVDWNMFTTAEGLERARANGTDQHSVVADPEFINPTAGDYRVRRGSAAEGIGFKNFPMDDFGVRTLRLRARAEQPSFPKPILRPPEGTPETPQHFAGMEIKSIETLGEQSAAGLPKKEGVLVLAVDAGGFAARAGLQPGDVVLSIVDDEYGQTDATPNAADFVAAAKGRLWRGEIVIEISRNQTRQKLHLPLK